jgi:hypothetical protein
MAHSAPQPSSKLVLPLHISPDTSMHTSQNMREDALGLTEARRVSETACDLPNWKYKHMNIPVSLQK